MNNALTETLYGQLAAHLPEAVSALCAWYTYKDMPYAVDLAAFQFADPAVVNTIVGAAVPLLKNIVQGVRGGRVGVSFGQGGGRRRRTKRQRSKRSRKH